MRSHSPIIPAIFSDNPKIFRERLDFAQKTTHSAQFDILDGIFCRGDENLDFEAWPNFQLEYSEAHLMVKKPLEYLEKLAEKKITRAIVHVESDFDLTQLRSRARELDLLLGFAINPDTDLIDVRRFFDVSNYIQVMGVNPGHTGQAMLETTIPAVSYLKRSTTHRLYITVDGGVTLENILPLRTAGADFFVTTNALFGQGEARANYQALEQALTSEKVNESSLRP